MLVSSIWASFVAFPPHADAAMPCGTTRASIAQDLSPPTSLVPSTDPSISASGRYVAFGSSANNLVGGDTNSVEDVFVKDVDTGSVDRVSLTDSDAQASSGGELPSISSDGTVVAFESQSGDLIGTPVPYRSVYVRNRTLGTTVLVSNGLGGVPGNAQSVAPTISANGRYVVFASLASNLVVDDTNGSWDVFVRDLVLGEITRVSVATDGTQGDGHSGTSAGGITLASISSDGRYVAFASDSTNLVGGDTNGPGESGGDVFMRDRTLGSTVRISVATDGTQGDDRSVFPSVSANGRYVVFTTFASNLHASENTRFQVLRRDTVDGTTTLVSLNTSGTGIGDDVSVTTGPDSMTPDGRYVVFRSDSSDISVFGASRSDLYVRDMQLGKTLPLSRRWNGAPNGSYPHTGLASISDDGEYVAWASDDDQLVDGDQNHDYDVFIRRRVAPDAVTVVPGQLQKLGSVQTRTLWGTNLDPAADFDFGSGINVESVQAISTEQLQLSISVAPDAVTGPRSLTITNPDGCTSFLAEAIELTPPRYEALADTGFDLGSPNPYWSQLTSDGRSLIQSGPCAEGFCAELCGFDNCSDGIAQGISQPLTVPAGVVDATLRVRYTATSDEDPYTCYDILVVGVVDDAGFSPQATHEGCISSSTGHQDQQIDVTGYLQAREGAQIYVLAFGGTDETVPSRVQVKSISLQIDLEDAVLPGPVGGVRVTAQDGSAYVSWDPPDVNPSGHITTYTVVANPGGATVSTSGHLGATVTGLTNGVPYTFSVRGESGFGSGGAVTSPPVVPTSGPLAGRYNAISPLRYLDTRDGTGSGVAAPIPPGGTLELQVTGSGKFPSGAQAGVFNVTVDRPGSPGYLTVFPTGVERPTASNLNFTSGQIVPNLVEVGIGTSGRISIYNGSSSATHVIVDAQGYVASAASGTQGLFESLVPARIFDTRPAPSNVGGTTKLPPGQWVDVQVTGRGGVPASGVAAASMNVTITEPEGNGYLTAYPTGVPRPTASNINFSRGETFPNRVIVPVGPDGKVRIFNGSSGSVHVVIDVGGWFSDGTDAGADGGEIHAVTPARIADTRIGSRSPYPGMTLLGSTILDVMVAGQGGVPAMSSPTPPTAVIVNLTVTGTSGSGFLTAFPSGVPRPLASDLNFIAGTTRPNLAIVGVGSDGSIQIYGSNGYADVILDVVGWID